MQSNITLDNAPWKQPSPVLNEFGKLAHHARRAIEAGDTERLMQVAEQLSGVEKWGQAQTDLYMRIAPHMPVADSVMIQAQKVNRDLLQGWGPSLEEMKKNWAELPRDQKVEVMQGVLDRQMEMYGLSNSPRIGLYEEPRDEEGGIYHGRYNPRSHRVEVNEHSDSLFNDFDQCIATVVHEGTHAVQTEMAKLHKAGKIKPGHPLAQTARVFAAELDFINRCEDSDHYPGGEYTVMAAERHAFHADHDFSRQLKDGAASRMVRAMRRQVITDGSAPAAAHDATADGETLLGGLTASMQGHATGGLAKTPVQDRAFSTDRLKP